MSEFGQIVATTADRLRALEIREIVYFHCDHFEPWDFSQQSREHAARQVADFVDAVQKVDFARRLTLFYSNAWNTRLSDTGDLVRAAPGDRLGFVRRSDADHDTLGAPFRYLRANSEHEIQIHIHHENFTWTRGMRDPSRAAYLSRPEARALDGLRLECAIEQWLDSARREFDYAPPRWFFVHGLWALNGSDPEGCNIHDEIARLMKWGCRGDFTFPAGRQHCDPRSEAPYFCVPAIGPKSYDSEAAAAEFAWGNKAAAADRFFVWNSPIKAPSASLDWGDRGVRTTLANPGPLAQEIIERSFRWDGVLFIKTHAHSMHRMNRDDGGRLIHPHCYGPTRDLYGAIFEAAALAGAVVTLATAGEVYDRFVGAARPAVVPPMSAFRPQIAGGELDHVGPTSERVLDVAAGIDRLATAAIAARIGEFGIDGSGAEPHYAAMSERGSVVPKHDVRAAHILLSKFGNRHPVHEIGAGIGGLPLLLAALGIPALGIESSQRRYDSCIAVAAHVARRWDGPLAPHSFLLGRFPGCVGGQDLSGTVAVITDFSCSLTAEERRELVTALRSYGAVLLDVDRFIRRIGTPEERKALIEELRNAGMDAVHDIDIASDSAFVVILNQPGLLHQGNEASGASAAQDPNLPALVELAGFELDRGHCFRVRLPPHFPPASSAPAEDCALILFQDGIRLGPSGAELADIRGTGAGRYAQSESVVYLSTRDNSDPRTNGSRLEAFHPLVGETQSSRVPDGYADHDAERRIPLSPPFRHEIGCCWTCRVDNFPGGDVLSGRADSEAARTRSPARLYENGAPLGPSHAAHVRIRESGVGAHAHWKGALYFSTSDNSDPNVNGRKYELRIECEQSKAQG